MNPCLRQHQKWTIILLWAILVGCINGETGYRCYTCASQNGDNTCLNNPNDVVVGSVSVPCDQENGEFGWCLIVRQEYTDIPGEVVSFTRMCVKTEPAFLDDVITDSDSTFYYRSCRSHLCNSGNGLETIVGGGGGGGGGAGGGDHIVVDGENGAQSSTSSLLSIIAFILLIRLL